MGRSTSSPGLLLLPLQRVVDDDHCPRDNGDDDDGGTRMAMAMAGATGRATSAPAARNAAMAAAMAAMAPIAMAGSPGECADGVAGGVLRDEEQIWEGSFSYIK
jgi:hypothetical protein